MGSTYAGLYYHLVFATKDRKPIIADTWRLALHQYLGGTISGLGGVTKEIGGVADHVHILTNIKTTTSVADFVRELKKSSSIWIKAHHCPDFAWQEGYGIFTVSATHLKAVKTYIQEQEIHHRKTTFMEEFRRLLEKNQITYDPKFLDQ